MILSRRTFVTSGTAAFASAALPHRVSAVVSPSLPTAALQADLDLLQHAYETVNPGLRRYLPPGGFAERIAAARRWASGERNLADFFVALARLTASVRCGHSHPNPFNQSPAARAALFAGRDRLPFAFRWIDGRMIVTGPRGGALPLPPGGEILMLDGTEPRRMLAAMLPLARADGSNDAKRVAQLGIAPRDRYAAFDMYRPMLFRLPGGGGVQVRVRQPDGQVRDVELPALNENEIEEARRADGGRLEWTFDINRDGIGRLTMPDWVTYRSKWDWKAFLDTSVDRLIAERARGLVVDIRGNEGGTECGRHLLERLVDRDAPLPAFVRKVRYRKLPADLHAALDTWDASFRDWGVAAAGPDSDGFYRLAGEDGDPERLRPRGRRFDGPVAVLVDASCSSATFQFASAVQAGGHATLIGEPTGGNRRGINGDAYFFVRLPETGLEVDLPIVGSFPVQPQPDAGIRPDRLVKLRARDIAEGRDRQFEAALAILRGKAAV